MVRYENRRTRRGEVEFSEWNVMFASMPGAFGNLMRGVFYRRTLAKVGCNVVFKHGSFCQYKNITIGNNVFCGYYNTIGLVNFGDNIVVGGFVNFVSGRRQHGVSLNGVPFWQQAAEGRAVVNIGSNVWIGSNCVICASVGDDCVLGVGSVLVKPMENKTVYAGNPARKIRDIA